MNFSDFNFTTRLQEGIESMRFQTATPIQEQAIPIILSGKDLIGCAQTGTGKTAAYLLPTMQKILVSQKPGIKALVIAPTRELAMQIDQQIEGLAYFTGISSIALYGGGDGFGFETQKKALLTGVDMVVATPGRLISQMGMEGMDFSSLEMLILDEADRMLDMGFIDDIMRIISKLPKTRQTLLFSATMPPKIKVLAQSILTHPEEVKIAIAKPAEGITQQAYSLYDEQKLPFLLQILKNGDHGTAIIFASTKDKVKEVHRLLVKAGVNCKAFHSDLEQSVREEQMRQFKAGHVPVLVGTDVLSRGIDVEGINLVLNYDVPPDAEDYVHRIGRTARADRKGTAITFINPKDQPRFYSIERLIEREVPKLTVPPALGETPKYDPEATRSTQKKPFNRRQKWTKSR